MHKDKGSVRAYGLDPFLLKRFIVFYFLLAFYFRILILYTTDSNPRINKYISLLLLLLLLSVAATLTLLYLVSTKRSHKLKKVCSSKWTPGTKGLTKDLTKGRHLYDSYRELHKPSLPKIVPSVKSR